MARNAAEQPSSIETMLAGRLADHAAHRRPRFEKLWRYYRNPLTYRSTGQGPARPAQAEGLPARLMRDDRQPAPERVIENDIAWRVHSLVDFMFGRPVTIQSQAADPDRAEAIGAFLRRVMQANGGVRFYQDLALLGTVYGHVDVVVDVAEPTAEGVRLQLVEAPRAVPVVNADDYRALDAFACHVQKRVDGGAASGLLKRWRERVRGVEHDASHAETVVYTADEVRQYHNDKDSTGLGRLVRVEVNPLRRLPVVHIQNLPQPFAHEGLSDVEPLIPLQDELNTRLSDRANRVTFQSFRMYLAKGIEGFMDRPVGPGQMWATDNPDAKIEEFGGDNETPSEDLHIQEIRQAMDKASSVPPLVAGMIQGRVGNLTSENALRLVMMGLLAKVEKKRMTYGQGLRELCELVLHAADVSGAFPNSAEERRVRLDWPNPLPMDERQQLENARLKLELGVEPKRVLAELGYDDVA